MKITFGSMPNNACSVALLGCTLVTVFTWGTFRIQYVLDDSHEALMQSSMPNVTSIKIRFFCGITYDDCRCSVQSAKNVYLKHCLTDHFLLGSRIFPLVSFILQICLIRDLFTLSVKYTRFVIYALWITAVFIFIIIANGIYRSSCLHRKINDLFGCTAAFLFMLVAHDALSQKNIARSSSNDHTAFNYHGIINDQTSEEINNEPVFLLDLL